MLVNVHIILGILTRYLPIRVKIPCGNLLTYQDCNYEFKRVGFGKEYFSWLNDNEFFSYCQAGKM